jgi:hypothetical protein
MVSGPAAHFASVEELVTFITRILADVGLQEWRRGRNTNVY